MKTKEKSHIIQYRNQRSGRIRISISERQVRYRMHLANTVGCVWGNCKRDAKFILPMLEPEGGFCGAYCLRHADELTSPANQIKERQSR